MWQDLGSAIDLMQLTRMLKPGQGEAGTYPIIHADYVGIRESLLIYLVCKSCCNEQ